jgi:large subunit ribosomal protein L23
VTDPHLILISPIISEKSLDLTQAGKFQFRVAMTANKIEIRKAIEAVFPRVHVTKVNTIIVKGKLQRRASGGRRVEGYKPDWKKATVTLAPGEKIPIFENL